MRVWLRMPVLSARASSPAGAVARGPAAVHAREGSAPSARREWPRARRIPLWGHVYDGTPVLGIDGERDVLVGDEPLIAGPLQAHGGAHPDRGVPPIPAGAAVGVEHVREGHVPADGNVQIVGFQADVAFVFVEPPQEVPADLAGAGELVRGDDVEVHDAG